MSDSAQGVAFVRERRGQCRPSPQFSLSRPTAHATMPLTMSREQRCIAFIIGVLSLVAPACSSSPSGPTATGPFVVVGQVLDFQSKAGVSGAMVSFGDLSSATVLPSDP